MPGFAASPWSTYQKSRHQDPTYQQAVHQYNYVKGTSKVAQSAIYPEISASYGYSKTLNRTPLASRYETESSSITAQQVLFNAPAYFYYLQTKELQEASTATLREAQQDLIIRTLSGYLNVLEAFDIYQASQSEVNELKERLTEIASRAKIGAAITADVERARAAYDLARSANSHHKTSIIRALDNLAVISNTRPHALKKLNPIPQWMLPQTALKSYPKNNPSLIAARLKIKAQHYNYKQVISDHLPSIKGQVSWTKNHYSGEKPFGLINSKKRAAGLSIDIPLFSGGRMTAQGQQAWSLYQQAKNQHTLIQRQIRRATQSYPAILSANWESVKASQQAVKSSQMDVETLRANYRVGNVRVSELLDAIKRLNTSKQLHAKNRYIYLKEYVNYLALQGKLTPKKLIKINQLFLNNINLPKAL